MATMTTKKDTIVVANWKMNPKNSADAKKLFTGVKDVAARLQNVKTVICPPYVFLPVLTQLYKGKRITFGAQDVFYEQHGAYTGEVSATQLSSSGAAYVIIGHSERRALGEDSETVNHKVRSALAAGLNVILCIGEKNRDAHALYLTFLQEQLGSALVGVTRAQLAQLLIAYEPIWAIGKRAEDAMKPQDMHETVIFIRKVLTKLYDKQRAVSVPVLYGGSVEPQNTSALLARGEISGFLVGHASLVPEEFCDILRTADKK